MVYLSDVLDEHACPFAMLTDYGQIRPSRDPRRTRYADAEVERQVG